MAKAKDNKTDWVSILEVLSFVISAAIEVVKKWKESEYLEEIKADSKSEKTEDSAENK